MFKLKTFESFLMEAKKTAVPIVEPIFMSSEKFIKNAIEDRNYTLSSILVNRDFDALFSNYTFEYSYRHGSQVWLSVRVKRKRNADLFNVYDSLEEAFSALVEYTRNAIEDARFGIKNPVNVGDVYYSSWGYDQTNITFYEVLEVLPKSIRLIEIGGDKNRATEDVKPNKSKRIGSPMLVKVHPNRDGSVIFKVDGRYVNKYDSDVYPNGIGYTETH